MKWNSELAEKKKKLKERFIRYDAKALQNDGYHLKGLSLSRETVNQFIPMGSFLLLRSVTLLLFFCHFTAYGE